jgi:AcrR family transcriptional regulator
VYIKSMPVKRSPRSYHSPSRDAAAGRTRARIVEAATTLLASGAGSFSLEAVAQHAGVTRLTVYNQFESKAGLLEAVFDDLAQRGGLFELPAAFAHPDPRRGLRRLITVFCRFWAAHRSMLPKFRAVIQSDQEIAARLKQRAERRRRGLTRLVERLGSGRGRDSADLIDVLFALTAFEMFEALSVRGRSPKAVEALVHSLAELAVDRYCEGGLARSSSAV